MGRRARSQGSVMVVASILLGACPRSAPPAKTQSKTRPSAMVEVEDPETLIGGAYECRLRTANDDFAGPCEISPNGKAFDIRMEVGSHRLSGSAEPTSYGLRFQGMLDQEAVTTDLIRQGARCFAAVLQLEDKSLYKLDLSPSS